MRSFAYSQFGISARPARGGCSDAVLRLISEPATVGSSNRGERFYDLPDGGKKMVMPSRGVRTTIVNWVTTYADGAWVGERVPVLICNYAGLTRFVHTIRPRDPIRPRFVYMVMPSRWVRYTIVNGATIYADGELVG
ncbi:MAG: hypothetical protein ABI728_14560, partial [Betaproteobacteria bacterium]